MSFFVCRRSYGMLWLAKRMYSMCDVYLWQCFHENRNIAQTITLHYMGITCFSQDLTDILLYISWMKVEHGTSVTSSSFFVWLVTGQLSIFHLESLDKTLYCVKNEKGQLKHSFKKKYYEKYVEIVLQLRFLLFELF